MPLPSGDFDKCANAMWSLHLGEAKGHDEARIHSVKDEMDGVIIFVCYHICVCSYLRRHRLLQFHALSHRLVYSPLPLRPFLPIAPTIFKPIRHSKWSTTSNRRSHCSLKSPTRFPPPHHKFPYHLLSLYHTLLSVQTRPMFGSTYSGS